MAQVSTKPASSIKTIDSTPNQASNVSSTKVSLLQYAWFGGHASVAASSAIFLLTVFVLQSNSRFGHAVYRLVWTLVIITYAISLYHKFQGQMPGFYVLLRMESFQFLVLATIWLFTKQHLLKVMPYMTFSVLHALSFVGTKLKPGTSIEKSINNLIDGNIKHIGKFLAYTNLLLLARLFLDVLTIQNGSGLSLIMYVFFVRIRFAYSPFFQELLANIRQFLNAQMDRPQVPTKAKAFWAQLNKALDSRETSGYELDPEKNKKMQERRALIIEEERKSAEAAKKALQASKSPSRK